MFAQGAHVHLLMIIPSVSIVQRDARRDSLAKQINTPYCSVANGDLKYTSVAELFFSSVVIGGEFTNSYQSSAGGV